MHLKNDYNLHASPEEAPETGDCNSQGSREDVEFNDPRLMAFDPREVEAIDDSDRE
jgi:predicted component of type VI protein secretion system